MKIKGKKLFLCLTMVIASLGSSAQAPTNSASIGTLDIDLAKAIEIALAENPTIKVADKDIQLKKIADKEAWQNLLPEVSASASLQHTLLAAKMKLGDQEFKMGKDNTNTAAAVATLNLPLFAPAVYQSMKLTKQDILLAQEKARGSRLDLVNQVTKAYFQMLLAKDAVEVMRGSYKTSQENYNIVNAKYTVGKVSEYDKISAEVQMRAMNSSLISSESGLTLAELQLKVLMGITENVQLNVNDKLTRYEDKLTLENINETESELSNNTAMRQLDLNQGLLERNLKLQRTNFMPTIGFQLQGQYQSLYNTGWDLWNYHWSPSASFALSINIPIFKASNWTKLKTTKLQISELEDTRVNTRNQLTMAVQSYKQNMASTIAQIGSNREAVNQASKAVSISAKRYEVGRGTILELNQSEVALTQAQLTYNQSIYDYLINKADLDNTLGREAYLR